MAAPALDAPERPLVTPRWGLGDAAVGWVVAVIASSVVLLVVASATGYVDKNGAITDAPLWLLAVSYPPLWIGFVGAPVWAASRKGNGVVRDFRLAFRWVDVPLGIVTGLVGQWVIVPLVSYPVLQLSGKTTEDLAKPAQDLADKAQSVPGLVLFALIVVIGAPIAEELFFRGLVLRAFEKRWNLVAGIVCSSILFGLTHFEALQTPALIAAGALFAVVSVRTNRLGTSIVAHMAFNAATVVALVVAR